MSCIPTNSNFRPAADEESSLPSDLFRDLDLKIEMLPIGAIKGYARNARTHTKSQIEQIARSIGTLGFVSPVKIDDDGTLIAGHGRIAAAKLLGRKTVPAIRITHLNDAEKRTLRLADNKLAELAGWNTDLLSLEFTDLLSFELAGDLTFDLTVTGFAPAEIDRLVDDGKGSSSAEQEKDDALPEIADAPVACLGDVFALGSHRIICGDARDPAAYEALLGDERAAMSISDAPYNVSIGKHVSKSGKHEEFVMGVGELDMAGFVAFLAAFLTLCMRFGKAGAIHFAFMDWRHIAEMIQSGGEAGLELKNLCVWDKGAGAMGSFYRSQHELVFVFKEPGAAHTNNIQLGKFGRNRTNVWAYPGAASLRKELELHPTPKPVALVADAIRDASNRNDIVLDAFAGSGTTIIAAAKTGRRARVIELDPHFVDVAIRRWESWSGEAAHDLATGKSFAELAKERAREKTAETTNAEAKAVAAFPKSSVRIRRRVTAATIAAE